MLPPINLHRRSHQSPSQYITDMCHWKPAIWVAFYAAIMHRMNAEAKAQIAFYAAIMYCMNAEASADRFSYTHHASYER